MHFNAWQVDYITDPLVALVSSVDRLELGDQEATSFYRAHLKTVKRVTSLVAKRGLMAATKALTLGALNLEEEIEAAASEFSADSIGDIVDAFNKERDLLHKFREELSAAVAQLAKAGKEPTLVFFIDELDRCRPTFAIELLERVKRLFDIPNIIFVLSIDKQQLEASTAAVYGSAINATEYLRRFIDLEYGIPARNSGRFTEDLIGRFGLDEVFAGRKGQAAAYDKQHFSECFTFLADAMNLSLRARERCITRLRIVLEQTPPNYHLHPILVALLIVLRSNNASLFQRLVNRGEGLGDAMEFVRSLPGGTDPSPERPRLLIEAYLMASAPDDARVKAREKELELLLGNDKTPNDIRWSASELLSIKNRIRNDAWNGWNLAAVAAKVDLAGMLRD